MNFLEQVQYLGREDTPTNLNSFKRARPKKIVKDLSTIVSSLDQVQQIHVPEKKISVGGPEGNIHRSKKSFDDSFLEKKVKPIVWLL